MTQKRNYGLDILKIISMMMVVFLHATSYGAENVQCTPLSARWFDISVTRSICGPAVDCFVLISGYFMCQKKFRIKHLIKLWIEVAFYSAAIYLCLSMIPSSGVSFSMKELIKSFMPLMTSSYWFFNAYFVLMMLSPLLNRLIGTMSRDELRKTVMLLIIIFAVIPTLDFLGDPFYSSYGYSFVWFAVLYMTASYIRLYGFDMRHSGTVYLLCTCAEILFNVLYQFPSDGHARFFIELQTYYNSVTVLLAAVSLFCFFRKLSIDNRRIRSLIEWTVPKSFAVYLIHEQPLFRNILWGRVIRLERFDNNAVLLMTAIIASVSVIFVICIVIDSIRKKLLSGAENRIADSIQRIMRKMTVING